MIKDGVIQLRDYDSVFDNNPDSNYFYNTPGYDGPKLIAGRVSLKNAKERLKKGEVYTIVKYHQGDELPQEYTPLNANVESGDTLFATINPDLRFYYLCANGGIQMISRFPDREEGNPTWLLGPGPDEVSLSELVESQLSDYEKIDTMRK
ncbi:MAG: hypothetical protein II119_03775 [Bacilli bacterium]|nr:hypothetical protein [Bacilli bacterium]